MSIFINIRKLFLLLSLLGLIPISINSQQKQELKKVTFMPMWIPQEQFAGYYMAKEKRIYEKYGLDVTIKSGGYKNDVVPLLINGEIDFGVMFLYSGVMERAKGLKLVNIGQISQQSDIMFVAKKKSGIKTLNDFNGKRIGVWKNTAKELTAGFIKKHNINAEVIEFDKGINLLLKDAVDITVVMNYNEYHRLINAGIDSDEIQRFNFYDYGMNFPEDGIYCMESTYNKDPDLCVKFVKATIEGWGYSLANSEETIKVLNKYKETTKVPYNKAHSVWMLNCMNNSINIKGKVVENGNLLESDYNSLADFLYTNKFISSKPLYTDFYKGEK